MESVVYFSHDTNEWRLVTYVLVLVSHTLPQSYRFDAFETSFCAVFYSTVCANSTP